MDKIEQIQEKMDAAFLEMRGDIAILKADMKSLEQRAKANTVGRGDIAELIGKVGQNLNKVDLRLQGVEQQLKGNK